MQSDPILDVKSWLSGDHRPGIASRQPCATACGIALHRNSVRASAGDESLGAHASVPGAATAVSHIALKRGSPFFSDRAVPTSKGELRSFYLKRSG